MSALIAGLGLTGFALGFALRDAVSNLIAGVLILLYQPFGLGNKITVGGNSGAVVGINFRYTVLEADGQAIIHVPKARCSATPSLSRRATRPRERHGRHGRPLRAHDADWPGPRRAAYAPANFLGHTNKKSLSVIKTENKHM